ncbi:MAG TPA: DUF554 domain-containing protein [Limnochordales bacterium]
MVGTLVNAAAIVAGSTLGMVLRRRAASAATDTVMQGLGLVTLLVGGQMAYEAISTRQPAAPLLSVLVGMALGAYLGERWAIERRLSRLGERARELVERRFGRQDGEFVRAFVASSLLFAVGPMAVVGSLADGISGDARILLTKSAMDGIASVALASAMGPGVFLSAGTVLVYQGSLTLAGAVLGRAFDPLTMSAIDAAGGLLILAIGLNMVGATRLPIGNLLPALAASPLLAWVWKGLGLP